MSANLGTELQNERFYVPVLLKRRNGRVRDERVLQRHHEGQPLVLRCVSRIAPSERTPSPVLVVKWHGLHDADLLGAAPGQRINLLITAQDAATAWYWR